MSATIALALCFGGAGAAGFPGILRHKEAQVRHLRQILDSPAGPEGRAARLFALAQLELEVAILRGPGREQALELPALTARRLLTDHPSFAQADRVRLFLAQVEIRRGRRVEAVDLLVDLQRLHPRSGQLCTARALAGDLRGELGDHQRSASDLRAVADDLRCPHEQRHRARYKLAWALLADKLPGPASRQLRELCREDRLSPALKSRALEDLVLAWSLSSELDTDVASFLRRHAGPQQTHRLVVRLGERLLAAGKVKALLAMTADYLRVTPNHPAADRLRVMRIRALSRRSTPQALGAELAGIAERLERSPRGGALRQAAARALLELAVGERAASDRDEAERPGQARQLLERLVAAYGDTVAGRGGRLHLAEILMARGELRAAARQLEEAERNESGAARRRASYRLVCCLERLLATLPADDPGRRPALERFVGAARRFTALYPKAEEVPGLLLALATHLLQAGSYQQAAALAGRLVREHPRAPQRWQAVDLGLAALGRAGQPERAYDLARAELGRCPAGSCRTIRAAAVAAALQLSKAAASKARWERAHDWALKATELNHGDAPSRVGAVSLMAGRLAARAGRRAQARRHLEQIIADPRCTREHVGAALVALAEQAEAGGELGAASKRYLQLAERAKSPAERVRWLYRAAVASHYRDHDATQPILRRLRGALAQPGLTAKEVLHYQLELGQLLPPLSAYRHYIAQAEGLWRRHPRWAARMLGRAAVSRPTARRSRALLEQALNLAGPLRRGAEVSPAAAETRLAVVRRLRAATDSETPAGNRLHSRLAGLQQALGQMLQLLALKDRRWSLEAGAELAWIYREMARLLHAESQTADGGSPAAIKALRDGAAEYASLHRRIAQGLGLAEVLPDRASVLQRLPRGSGAAAAAIARLRTGGDAAAAHIATTALTVYGARGDLHCVRGVARFLGGELSGAVSDLRAAARLDPTDQCAQLLLAPADAGPDASTLVSAADRGTSR